MTMSHAMPPAASHVARFLSFSYTFFRKETNSYGHSVTKSAQAAAFMNPTQRSRIAFENMIFLLKKTKTLVNQPALSQSPERESQSHGRTETSNLIVRVLILTGRLR